ncbi:hypothetical protein [Embleya sp. MST-111070]|uniref:imine reductase family protein n=1 Tax=Embleya sp. MST-111070 TaxID=3398231 RepID=UPI003F741760
MDAGAYPGDDATSDVHPGTMDHPVHASRDRGGDPAVVYGPGRTAAQAAGVGRRLELGRPRAPSRPRIRARSALRSARNAPRPSAQTSAGVSL